MPNKQPVEHIADEEILTRHLAALVELDPRLAPVRRICGDIPLRRGPDGFAGLAHIVISQLLSVASARAIHGKFCGLLGEVSAERFLALPQEMVMTAGLTRAKYATLRGLAEAELSGALDYQDLLALSADDAVIRLCTYKGIGPWSAELYLLSALGHPDVFPAGDLALQKAAAMALGFDDRPDTIAMRRIAASWSPYRAVAAQLLWRYFAVRKEREGINL